MSEEKKLAQTTDTVDAKDVEVKVSEVDAKDSE